MTTSAAAPLIIVCDWLPPAFGAVGQYEMARAESSAASGRETVLIGLGDGSTPERESRPRLEIRRLGAEAAPKTSTLRRGLWTLRANWRLFQAMRRAARERPDAEIKLTGSPPFLAYAALLWSAFSRRRIVYRITDFYPETALAAGKLRWLRLFAPIFHRLRRRAARIEALSECQKIRLIDTGAPSERIAIIRDGSPVSFAGAEPLRSRPFEKDDVVLLYSGNLGVAHDWRSFAEGYARHIRSGANRARLWMNATGARLDDLAAFCAERDLPLHRSGPVPIEDLAGLMLCADAHLILLGDPFWGYVFPSKTYAALESGRPTLYVGPEQSDVDALLAGDPRNRRVRQADVNGVAEAIDALTAATLERRRQAAE